MTLPSSAKVCGSILLLISPLYASPALHENRVSLFCMYFTFFIRYVYPLLLHLTHPLSLSFFFYSPLSLPFPSYSILLPLLAEATPHQRFLATSVVMGVGIPVAFVLSPSIINFPIDLAIGIALPYHMHTGMLDVVNDYAPPQGKKPISVIVTLISVLVAIGLLKINLCGVGITQSLKSLWKKPAAKQAAPAIQQK